MGFNSERVFKFKASKAALQNLILKSIDEKYVKALKKPRTRYPHKLVP